jgi:ketosteroid isomerase-like protein
MTTEHSNSAIYRRTADAFRAGDFAALGALLDDDVVWHVPGSGPRSGDQRGPDAVIAWLSSLKETGFFLAEHDVFGNDEHVCALSVMGVHRPGIDLETRVVSIFHYHDGRQAERWFYPEDPDVWERILDA